MYTGTKKSEIQVYLSNLPGWFTKRIVVVIESDDWGSVYMSDRKSLEAMKTKGVPLTSHYVNNDTLESNEDMEMLFEVLRKHKDATGRKVVMTGLNVVAKSGNKKSGK